MSFEAQILQLTKQLYPEGRAFRMPSGSDLEKLHVALSEYESNVLKDAISIFDSILPDNLSFNSTDADDWYVRLGLAASPNASIDDRKAAVNRKMAHPGKVRTRLNYLYLENQLQSAGFDLYIHENRFPLYPTGYEWQNPYSIYGPTGWNPVRHGQFRHGQTTHGSQYRDIAINSIDNSVDANFDFSKMMDQTFFVGGQTLGTFANVDVERKTELRQLILKIKPIQTIAYLFINYI